MKDIFALFCVRFAKRNSDVRKRGFLKWFVEFCAKSGYTTKLDEMNQKKHRSRNLIVGDLKKCNTVVIAGYDTANKIVIPNYKYYPFNIKKDQNSEMISLGYQLFLSALLILAFFFVVQGFNDATFWWKVLAVVVGAILVITIFLLGKGMANKYNFNKNTASLAIATSLMQEYGKERDKSVAFIFADNTSSSFLGYMQIAENNKTELRGKKVIVMDCVMSDGEVFAGYVEEGQANADLIHEIHPDINMLKFKEVIPPFFTWLPTAIYLTSGTKVSTTMHESEVAVSKTRTRKDSAMDFNRLDAIYDIVDQFIKK